MDTSRRFPRTADEAFRGATYASPVTVYPPRWKRRVVWLLVGVFTTLLGYFGACLG